MNPLNPFQDHKPFFNGRGLLEWFNTGNKRGRHTRNWQYARMKDKQVERRRMRNKMARKSRRKNRLYG